MTSWTRHHIRSTGRAGSSSAPPRAFSYRRLPVEPNGVLARQWPRRWHLAAPAALQGLRGPSPTPRSRPAVRPGPSVLQCERRSRMFGIAGAGSVRISSTLPTTSVAASTRSPKCASCHKHGDSQPIYAAKAYVGRSQRCRPVSCFTLSPTAPKDFLKGRRRDATTNTAARELAEAAMRRAAARVPFVVSFRLKSPKVLGM
jgi:hypothetical protein